MIPARVAASLVVRSLTLTERRRGAAMASLCLRSRLDSAGLSHPPHNLTVLYCKVLGENTITVKGGCDGQVPVG